MAKLAALTAAALALLVLAGPAVAGVNPQLAGLQVALRAQGLYCGAIDGIAGPATAKAVKAFQRRARLPVDGIAGPRTRRALGRRGRHLYGSRAMTERDVGWDVAALQFAPQSEHGVAQRFDGVLGAHTLAALLRFQRKDILS